MHNFEHLQDELCQPWTPYMYATNKKLLGAPGRTTRSKDATRGSAPGLTMDLYGVMCLYVL